MVLEEFYTSQEREAGVDEERYGIHVSCHGPNVQEPDIVLLCFFNYMFQKHLKPVAQVGYLRSYKLRPGGCRRGCVGNWADAGDADAISGRWARRPWSRTD